MTHDELLTRLNYELSAAEFEDACGDGGWPKGVKALRAVLELHKPARLDDGCAHCKLTNTDPRPYPCPTIQAIEKELI